MIETQIISKISDLRELLYSNVESKIILSGYNGILPPHLNIIEFLYKKDKPVAINNIVEKTGKAKSTVTSNLQTLEKFGYIDKTKNPLDNRSTLISLSEKGVKFVVDFDHIADELLTNIYENIDERELSTLLKTLTKLEENLKNNI
jgi:DNA-binding MarR family transcriptional regulator